MSKNEELGKVVLVGENQVNLGKKIEVFSTERGLLEMHIHPPIHGDDSITKWFNEVASHQHSFVIVNVDVYKTPTLTGSIGIAFKSPGTNREQSFNRPLTLADEKVLNSYLRPYAPLLGNSYIEHLLGIFIAP